MRIKSKFNNNNFNNMIQHLNQNNSAEISHNVKVDVAIFKYVKSRKITIKLSRY